MKGFKSEAGLGMELPGHFCHDANQFHQLKLVTIID